MPQPAQNWLGHRNCAYTHLLPHSQFYAEKSVATARPYQLQLQLRQTDNSRRIATPAGLQLPQACNSSRHGSLPWRSQCPSPHKTGWATATAYIHTYSRIASFMRKISGNSTALSTISRYIFRAPALLGHRPVASHDHSLDPQAHFSPVVTCPQPQVACLISSRVPQP